MARPLRIIEPDGDHHERFAGNNKERIFWDDGDFRALLTILAKTVARHELRLYSYCLMPNHFHLVVRVPHANLSAAMQYLNGGYSRRTNVRYGRVRHLFQNRFEAVHIRDDSHLLTVLRYVVLNPVDAGRSPAAGGLALEQLPLDCRTRARAALPRSRRGARVLRASPRNRSARVRRVRQREARSRVTLRRRCQTPSQKCHEMPRTPRPASGAHGAASRRCGSSRRRRRRGPTGARRRATARTSRRRVRQVDRVDDDRRAAAGAARQPRLQAVRRDPDRAHLRRDDVRAAAVEVSPPQNLPSNRTSTAPAPAPVRKPRGDQTRPPELRTWSRAVDSVPRSPASPANAIRTRYEPKQRRPERDRRDAVRVGPAR